MFPEGFLEDFLAVKSFLALPTTPQQRRRLDAPSPRTAFIYAVDKAFRNVFPKL